MANLTQRRAASLARLRDSRPMIGLNLDSLTVVPPRVGQVRKPKARMTGAQRDSVGDRSAWSASPYYWTNPGWDARNV